MGLDMYLYRKTYAGNKYRKPAEQVKVKGKGIQQKRVTEISEEVGYWRKANAIHKWFVDNVQDGNDDCHEYYVSKEKLQELLDLVNRVLEASIMVKGKVINGYSSSKGGPMKPNYEDGEYIKDSSVAEELLPTTEGFFFGGKEYDQWYVQDLRETRKILEAVLKEEGDYYYQSSW